MIEKFNKKFFHESNFDAINLLKKDYLNRKSGTLQKFLRVYIKID